MNGEKITQWELQKIFTQPFYAINFHESLFGEHETIITRKQWIEVGCKLIKDIGPEAFLGTLLDSLENPITMDESGSVGGYKNK